MIIDDIWWADPGVIKVVRNPISPILLIVGPDGHTTYFKTKNLFDLSPLGGVLLHFEIFEIRRYLELLNVKISASIRVGKVKNLSFFNNLKNKAERLLKSVNSWLRGLKIRPSKHEGV